MHPLAAFKSTSRTLQLMIVLLTSRKVVSSFGLRSLSSTVHVSSCRGGGAKSIYNDINSRSNTHQRRAAAYTKATSIDDVIDDAPDYSELPPTDSFPHRNECLVGLEAVRKACAVIVPLQPECNNDDDSDNDKQKSKSENNGIATVSKSDASPVTVADFAAQAVTLGHIHRVFPGNSFIAEESSEVLHVDTHLADQVLKASGLESHQVLFDSIDLGKEYETWSTAERQTAHLRPSHVWCLDPIDGTKGFLRGRRSGGQYAVALALLVDGVPKAAVLACPNLPSAVDDEQYSWRDDETLETNAATRGCIFVASVGGGCYQLPLIPNSTPVIGPLKVSPNQNADGIANGRFCLGVEKFSDALGQCAGMALILYGPEGVNDEVGIVRARRMDSQCKYGVLARAGAEYYARLTRPGYVEWIWDHAAGKVVIEAAGGTMTDTEGREIDFSLGAKMNASVKGVLASNGSVYHTALIESFARQEVDRLAKALDQHR